MEIGIIGFGRFGKFMAKHLSLHAKVFVTDIENNKSKIFKNIEFTDLNSICRKKIIILAVPMESLEIVLEKIKNKLKPKTLILDICSLKVFSSKLMEKILPKNIEIIGTHPLFGPQSNAKSIKNAKIVLCNIRSKKLNKVKFFCEKLQLQVFITTPTEHDKQMAISQALTHFIGQIGKNMKLSRVIFSTKTFDNLMDVMDIIKNDTKALFENMQTMNPFAKEARELFVKECINLNEKLK